MKLSLVHPLTLDMTPGTWTALLSSAGKIVAIFSSASDAATVSMELYSGARLVSVTVPE